jgi:phage terminase large subunit-like protein
MYINRAARMFAMWNDKGRMPWHTQDYYQQEESVLMPNEFRRIHQNQWVTSEDIFVPLEWWDACKGEKPDEHHNEGWVIALDAGVSDDTFAIVGMTRHPTDTDRSIVRYSRRWKPPKNGKIELMGTEDNPGPEMELQRLFQSHNIIQVAYDPFQLEFFASRMSAKHSVWFRAFSQAKERLVADNTLRKMIQEKRIIHGGEPDLREHIGNANSEIDPEERKIRIVKRSELLKIDLAVALSMANCEIMRLNL